MNKNENFEIVMEKLRYLTASTNSCSKGFEDADTLLADLLDDALQDNEITGGYDEMVSLYRSTTDKKTFSKLFEAFTGVSFEQFILDSFISLNKSKILEASSTQAKRGNMLSSEEYKLYITALKMRYAPGTVIEMVKMNGETSVNCGDTGVVRFVDDIGTIQMDWGKSSLGIVAEVDEFKADFDSEKFHSNSDMDFESDYERQKLEAASNKSHLLKSKIDSQYSEYVKRYKDDFVCEQMVLSSPIYNWLSDSCDTQTELVQNVMDTVGSNIFDVVYDMYAQFPFDYNNKDEIEKLFCEINETYENNDTEIQ